VHFYRVAGLGVASEIALPGAIAAAQPAPSQPDIVVRVGAVPENLPQASARGPTWQIAGDRFLFRIPEVARFLLVGGREVVFETAAGVAPGDISIFLTGTVLGILLHQRGQVVLHASAVRVNGKAVLFCGASGAGKSTLAAALAQRGFPLVTDDFCAVAANGAGAVMVQPDGRSLKLWA
jgi:ABC-type multidrug transport system fused ATPase/permease subunit